MEPGLGFRFTTSMVNQHRIDEGLEPVGMSAVYNHFDRMSLVISSVTKCCQSNNNSKAWVLERYGQTKKFSIIFGQSSNKELESEYITERIPKWLGFPRVSPDQVI